MVFLLQVCFAKLVWSCSALVDTAKMLRGPPRPSYLVVFIVLAYLVMDSATFSRELPLVQLERLYYCIYGCFGLLLAD